MSLYLSSYCNFHCSYCIYGNMKKQHMEYNHAIKRIDEAISLGVSGIGISGGEPSLNPHYLDIIKYMMSKNLFISFISNGYNVKDEDLKQIAFYPKISFWFSLDSHKEDINDYLRCKGAFRKTIDYIKKVKKVNPNATTVNISLITRRNLADFETTADFILNKLGINTLKVERPLVLDRCLEIGKNELIIDTRDYVHIMDKISNKYPSRFFPNILSMPKTGCTFINENNFFILIFPNGDIYPCCYIIDEDLKIGDKNMSLMEVLKKENIRPYHTAINECFFKNYEKNISEKGMHGCIECVEEYKKLKGISSR